MYKHLTQEDIRKCLLVPSDYVVDGIIVSGTNPKTKEYVHLYEALEKLGLEYKEEKIEEAFFSEVKSFLINGKRIWFDVAYGTTYLSELIHWGSMLGSKANILLGTCGALQEGMETTDSLIPTASYGNESSTRMYQRDNKDFLYAADVKLSALIKRHIAHRETIHDGKLMTVQAMLAETAEDVQEWHTEGYQGIDMESATLFAVSNHFGVPSAALLFVVDNLIENHLVTDESFELLRSQRVAIRKENYEIAFKAMLDAIN